KHKGTGEIEFRGTEKLSEAFLDFNTEEARAKRKKGLKMFGLLSKVQLPLSILAVLSGATTTLVAAIFGYKASQHENNVVDSVPASLGVNYGLMMATNCGLGGLAVGNSGGEIGLCASNNDKCTPNDDAKLAFAILDLVLCFGLLMTVWFGMGLHWKYGRSYHMDSASGSMGCKSNNDK
ncbi:hypothetical protein BaRGS_00024291, partial [Batillaria attramentaria]